MGEHCKAREQEEIKMGECRLLLARVRESESEQSNLHMQCSNLVISPRYDKKKYKSKNLGSRSNIILVQYFSLSIQNTSNKWR